MSKWPEVVVCPTDAAEIWVAAANTCNQIFLERLDGLLGCFGAMQVGRGELEGDS